MQILKVARRRLRPETWFGCFALVLGLTATVTYARADSEPVRQNMAEAIRACVNEYWTAGQFRGSVLVAMNGKVVAEADAGFADESQYVRNGPDTLFRIGSITKSFAAAAVLVLEEDGLLQTSAFVGDYLPEYPAENLQQNGGTVTIETLLHHTSGLAQYEFVLPLSLQVSPSPLPAKTVVHYLMQEPLVGEPGKKYRYNNANYDLLGLIIERVSGLTFEQFVRERLAPLMGVSHIGAVATPAEKGAIAKGWYPIGPCWFDTETAFGVDAYSLSPSAAAGNLFASSRELHRSFRALVNGHIFRHASSLERLLKPGRSEYGYGVLIDTYKGWKRISHGGSIVGSASQVEYFPEKDAAIVVLSNGDALGISMSALLGDLRLIIRGEPSRHTLRPNTFSREVAKASGGALFFLFSGQPAALVCLALGLGWCLWTASRRRTSRLSAFGAATGGLAGTALILELAGAPGPLLLSLFGLTGFAAGVGVWRTADEPGRSLPATEERHPLQTARRALEMAVTTLVFALLVTILAARDREALASACAGAFLAILTARVCYPRSSTLRWCATDHRP